MAKTSLHTHTAVVRLPSVSSAFLLFTVLVLYFYLFVQKLPDKSVKLFHKSRHARAESVHAIHVCERFKVCHFIKLYYWAATFPKIYALVYILKVAYLWIFFTVSAYLFFFTHLHLVGVGYYLLLLNRNMIRVTWDSNSRCEGTIQN